MSTSVRDFSEHDDDHHPRARSQTWASRGHNRSPTMTRSPPAHDDRDLDRRGSVASRLTRVGTNEQHANLRHRALSRSNTVKVFHEEQHQQAGAEPGINIEDEKIPPHLLHLKAACEISVVDFSEASFTHKTTENEGLAKLLSEPRPEGAACRWINVNGLDWEVIKCIGRVYPMHRLAVEDMVFTHSRTKVDWYKDQAFVILTLQKLVRLHYHGDGHDCPARGDDISENGSTSRRLWPWPSRKTSDVLPRYLDSNGDGMIDATVKAHSSTSEDSPIKDIRTLHRYESAQIPEHTAFMEKHSALMEEDLVVSVEQVSIFLLDDNTVISFFEHSADDIEDPILKRLASEETMLRRSGDASLMLQAIIDAIVDLALPVRDAYNKARKELQIDAMTSPDIRTSRKLHIFGEEIDMLQNLVKPIVHLVNALRDHRSEPPKLPSEGSPPLNPSPPPDYTTMPENIKPNAKPDPRALARVRGNLQAPLMSRSMSDIARSTGLSSQQSSAKNTPSMTSVHLSPTSIVYFGDVLDHCIVLIQAFEQMDASANNISTLIFNTVGARTNNFMMVLAIVTVFFAPLTTVSGYFGMNFASGAGLAHPFAFFFVVAIPATVGTLAIVAVMMLWDTILDWLAKRGVAAGRRKRLAMRRGQQNLAQ